MKIPKSVTIGGCKIKINVRELDEVHGHFLYDKMLIELDTSLLKDPKNVKKILRHEMVEASLMIAGVGWSELYDQEPVVRALDNIFWPAWTKIEKRLG